MGDEAGQRFFRDLVRGNGLSVRTGHPLLTNLTVSGEVPLALTVYNYMPEGAKKKGAPIDWFALEPAVAQRGLDHQAPAILDSRLLRHSARIPETDAGP